jgi:hypothetical protein
VDLLGDIEDGGTSKNQPKCNHSICGYMWFVVVCN